MSSTASAPTERRGARTGTRTRRPGRHPEGLERLRILLAGAMGAILVGYALLVPVAALLLASGGSGSLDGSFAIAVPMWLAAHQIPVEVEGRALGMLPLTPTVVVVVVVAVAAGWSVRRLGGRIRHDAGPVVAGQAGAAAAVAVLAGALLPGDVSVTTPWASMVGAGLLAGLAAGVGVLRACGLPPEWTRVLRRPLRAGLSGARVAAAGLVLSGAVVVLAALVARAGAVADSFAGLAPDAGASAGVLLLAVGYLPNMLVAGVAWSLGPGFAVGAAQYGPFTTEAGALPPFPLFAALPTGPVPGWSAVVLLLPAATGVLAGLVCRRALGADAPLPDRAVAGAVSAAVTAVGAGIVATVAGGSLAGGPYDPVSLSPVGVLATALLLLGVPATVAAVGMDDLLGRPPSRRSAGGRARPASREERSRDDRAAPDGAGSGDGAGDDGPDGSGRDRAARRGSGRTGRDGSRRTASRRHGDGSAGEGTDGSRRDAGRDGSGRDRPERAGSERDGEKADGEKAGGSGRDRPGRSERVGGPREGSGRASSARDGSTGRDRSARDDGPARHGSREKPGRETPTRDGSAGRTRDGSGPGGRSGGTGRDGATRPRTVGDLVAQQAGKPDHEEPDTESGTGGETTGR